jgi:DNA-binding transcriptional ArsR family regulator
MVRGRAGAALGRLDEHFTSWLSEAVTATDQLSVVFAALADPTRRAILAELSDGDATVTQLTAPLPISMPAVSRHLKVLEGADLISRSREGKWQRSHLEAAPLREAAVWIERFRRFWDSSFDRLDAHLAALQAEQENR